MEQIEIWNSAQLISSFPLTVWRCVRWLFTSVNSWHYGTMVRHNPRLRRESHSNVSAPHHFVDLPLPDFIFTAAAFLESWSQSGARLNSNSSSQAQGEKGTDSNRLDGCVDGWMDHDYHYAPRVTVSVTCQNSKLKTADCQEWKTITIKKKSGVKNSWAELRSDMMEK